MFVGLTLLMLIYNPRSVASVPAAQDWTDCLPVCQCKWTSGKKTALCRDAGFTSIPTKLNADMQVLDITGNSISHLPKDTFLNVGLIHLQRIFLKSAGIYSLHRDAFRQLKILVDVDLSDNFISVLHPDTFTGNDRLRAINLNGNPLGELKRAQFPNLPHLKSLEFQHCQIKLVNRDAFLRLPALESLYLNGNKLNYLSETVFLPVPNLKTLVLDANPWQCDCKLRAFRNWLLQSKLYAQPLVCSHPAPSQGKMWNEVPAGEFACAANVTIGENVIQGVLGGNMTLKCTVYGDPEPAVTWLFNGYLLYNDTGGNLLQDNWPSIEEKYTEEKGMKWSLAVLVNISDSNAGDYTCRASNLRGESSANVSLVLPKEAVATTMKKEEKWFRSSVFLAVIAASVLTLTLLITILCHIRHRIVKKQRRRTKLFKGSVTFSDQDKKLLDASITTATTDRQTIGSCEGFGSQTELDMMEQSVQSLPLDQPVHITIESHPTDPSSISVYPPPPEFGSSILPHGTFGNIFISVSVGQDRVAGDSVRGGSVEAADTAKYPDLIDAVKTRKIGGPEPESINGYYAATLPRRNKQPLCLTESDTARTTLAIVGPPHYDNMGPRITADGSSTMSLPETISIEEIPTPPPPPSCSPLTVDYISL